MRALTAASASAPKTTSDCSTSWPGLIGDESPKRQDGTPLPPTCPWIVITIATPRGELELASSSRPFGDDGGALLTPGELEFALWAFDADPRAPLVRIARALCVGTSPHDARTALVRALTERRIVARLRSAGPIAVPAPQQVVLGPSDHGDLVPDEFIQVMLFDAAGRALVGSHATFDLELSTGKTFRDRPLASGFGRIPSIPPGGPSACSVLFHDVADGAAPVLAEAAPDGPVQIDPSYVRGPLVGPTYLRLRELDEPQPAVVGATNVFQLLRRRATVIELEHFAEGSALFRPGPTPPDVALQPDALPVEGLDVLFAALERARDTSIDRMLLTGHGGRFSKERADCVRALLLGDAGRARFIELAQTCSSTEDSPAFLAWIDVYLRYECDPAAQVGGDAPTRLYYALAKLQRHYDTDVERGLFPSDPGFPPKTAIAIDGVLGPETWGAIFDCVERALRRVPIPRPEPPRRENPYLVVDHEHQTYPVLLAEIAAPGATENARAQHWKDLDPLNPQKVIPQGGGWYPIYPGDVIVLTPTWDLQKLIAHGYDVRFPDPPPEPPPPPVPAGPLPLSLPGPRVFDCGVKHPTSPFADADERRTCERRVELVFVEDALPSFHVCEGASCRTQTCELYDPRQTQLEYVVVGHHWDLFFDPRLTPTEADERYRLFSSDGAYDQTLSRGLARPHGRRSHLRFEGTDAASTYTLMQVLADGYELTIASDFALRD